MVGIQDNEHLCVGRSANDVFYLLHRKMLTHDGSIEVAGIQAYSNFVVLFLCNYKAVYLSGGVTGSHYDSWLLHSLKFLLERFTKGNRNSARGMNNSGGVGINFDFVLGTSYLSKALKDVSIFAL